MNDILNKSLRVLAIDPSTRGLGYAVLEGPERLVDWGNRQAAGENDADKNAACVAIVRELIERYRPHVLVIENAGDDSSRRRERVQELLDAIRQMARDHRVKVPDVTLERVRQAFAPTKDMIAAAIAGRFPELQPRLPKVRTLTMSEQYEMPVFDAMAFALAYFHDRNRKRLSDQRAAVKQTLR